MTNTKGYTHRLKYDIINFICEWINSMFQIQKCYNTIEQLVKKNPLSLAKIHGLYLKRIVCVNTEICWRTRF